MLLYPYYNVWAKKTGVGINPRSGRMGREEFELVVRHANYFSLFSIYYTFAHLYTSLVVQWFPAGTTATFFNVFFFTAGWWVTGVK